MPQSRRAQTLPIILALVGSVVLVWATPLGANITPDSVAYIGAARSLLDGAGLSMPAANGPPQVLTHYPPLYPLLLALSGVTGVDLLRGARWLNVVFLAANILLINLILRRCLSRRRPWFVLGGLLIAVLSVTMLRIHAAAWTEPAALFFGFGSLLLVSTYLEHRRLLVLVIAAIAASMAFLTRYASLPYIVAAVFILLVSGKPSRWRDVVVFCVVALLPNALWTARNLWLGTSATNRALGVHLIQVQHIKAALNTISTWVLPAAIPATFRIASSLGIGIGLVLVYLYFGQPVAKQSTADRTLLKLIVLFGVTYSSFLVLTVSFIDALLPFDQRMLSPLFVVWIVLLVAVLDLLPPRATALLLGLFVVSGTLATGAWALRNRQNGDGYTTRSWQQSPVIAAIKQLPPGTPIYSNGEDAVYLLTGRPASSVPHTLDILSNQPDQHYTTDLKNMEHLLRTQDAVIVYFNRFPERIWNVSESQLTDAIPLQVLYSGEDGTIYAIH